MTSENNRKTDFRSIVDYNFIFLFTFIELMVSVKFVQ